MRPPPRASLLPLALLLLGLGACIPGQVKDLNAMGDQAVAQRRYEQAVSYYSQSLALYPEQDKVRQRLESARVLLRQIYVDNIYDIVDGASPPVGEFLKVWKMSAALPSLGVSTARVVSIRLDLSRRFARSEPKLRGSTEPHGYYLHLQQMIALVPDGEVERAQGAVGAILQGQHLAARDRADGARQPGLALLHAAAAATFAPRDTGLWADVARRRELLRRSLALPISLLAQGASAAEGEHLLGGLRRRLPVIFAVTAGAPLALTLRARRPEPLQRQVRDQLSARCQVGVEREPNPECDALKRRAETAQSAFDTQRRALEAATARCAGEAQASTCQSNLRSENDRLTSAKREVDELEQKVGSCPRTIEKPIYKLFFYLRHTLTHAVTAAGNLTVTRGGTVVTSRPVTGEARAEDTFGDGLSCAGIPPDPLQIDSLAALQGRAEGQLLDNAMGEILTIRRQTAEKQLAGSESKEGRLDALVRARLVDESYPLARKELSRHLAGSWSADFDLPKSILR